VTRGVLWLPVRARRAPLPGVHHAKSVGALVGARRAPYPSRYIAANRQSPFLPRPEMKEG
jgi:hypothetical protein